MLSIKQSTRAFSECNLRLFGVSRLNLSSSRQIASKNSERILTKRVSLNFVSERGQQSRAWDVNTNVVNNVLLYKYDRPRLFRFLNALSPFQCIFWLCTAYYHYTHTTKRDPKETLLEYVKRNCAPLFIVGAAVFTGVTVSLMIYAMTSRSVKYIVLKKGGDAVIFFTYRPFKPNTGLMVPLEHVSCKVPRKDMVNYIPLRVKGRSFFYILDASGEFINPRLFDCTVGFIRFA